MGIFDALGNKWRNGSWWSGIKSIFTRLDGSTDALLEEVYDELISGDVGLTTSSVIITNVKKKIGSGHVDRSVIYGLLIDEITNILNSCDSANDITTHMKKPHVVMMVGVNGAGKTTTIAKLANVSKNSGKAVIVGACDTFRAAAVQQLCVWCDRIGVEIIKSENKAPATVAYETVNKAISEDFDMVFIDTAGRLQNNNDLMNELVKMKRVVAKVVPCENIEVVIVLDASIGQNATSQLDLFNKAIGVDGIVLTKTDGLAKGGFIIGLINDFHIPIKYIGYGENLDDIRRFDVTEYAKAFVG